MTIFANAFMTMVLGIFMMFLTDFSGIVTTMTKWGAQLPLAHSF